MAKGEKRERDDKDSSSESSDSSSDSGSEEKKRQKKHRHRHKSTKKDKDKKDKRSSKKHKSNKHKKDKDKHRHKSKDKKRQQEKGSGGDSSESSDEPRTGNLTGRWGKYGVIKDDAPEGSKYELEFSSWMSEVTGIGAAALAKWELEEYWKTFCEDFNTGTLPSKKYYDLRKWSAKQARDGVLKPVERTAFNDEDDIRRGRLEESKVREQQVSKETLLRMGATNAIEDMRAQELAKLQMQHAWKTGDVKRAEEMLKKFEPDTEEDKWRQLKKEAREGPSRS